MTGCLLPVWPRDLEKDARGFQVAAHRGFHRWIDRDQLATKREVTDAMVLPVRVSGQDVVLAPKDPIDEARHVMACALGQGTRVGGEAKRALEPSFGL